MKKAIIATLLFVIISIVALPPVVLGTKTYPVAIVDGSSMYPTLHSGDLVLYQSVTTQLVPNGTIIVAIPGETGLTLTDQLMAPAVIHRVVGTVVQADGTVYYKTKGDNNAQADPWLTRSDHVLGTPMAHVPYAGALVTFMQSTQGMVVMLGAILFIYLSRVEDKVIAKDDKEKLTGSLAEMTLNGVISQDEFEKFKLAIDYADDVHLDKLTDHNVLALLDWVREGGGQKNWTVKKVKCPRCGRGSRAFEGGNSMFLLCECQKA